MKRLSIFALFCVIFLCSCNNAGTSENTIVSEAESTSGSETSATENNAMGYKIITQKEAKEIMDGAAADFIILDVRRQDEFDEKHIPNAICLPNEHITEGEQPEELPDKEQLILVYCRSGRRSKLAAQKLADMGYTNVREFGGIIDWVYETVGEN